MEKKIKLNEEDIKNIVSIFLEQEEDEWVKVSPEKYKEIMTYAGFYAPGVAKLPQFKGKKIWITGNLDLSNTPTKSLDGVYYIDGSLNVSRTEVSNIDHIKVKGHISDYSSPLETQRNAKIKRQKISAAESRREDDEWNLENTDDDEAISANAIMEYFRDY